MPKEKSIEQLKKEIALLRLEKEKQLVMADNERTRAKLKKELEQLKIAEKNPTGFKKTMKTFGKGLNMIWGGVQKASRNLEGRNSDLRMASKPQQRGGVSNPAKMWLPKNKMPKQIPLKNKSRNKSKVNMNKVPMSKPWELA